MKRLRMAICLAMIGLCLPGILRSAKELPRDNQALVEKKYAGWSGVLRIWAFEGWTGGDLMARWVGACAPEFEKSHPGVYVEVIYPGEEAVRQLGRTGVRVPDMILFPPGLLSSHEGLAALPNGSFAQAVALGGYAWAINDAAEGTTVPPDEDWRSWSRAVESLGDPGAIIEEIEITPPGIDLGLPAAANASDALTRFMNGELYAIAVTQREIARLERLREQGRGPEWRIQTGGTWTDQAIYCSIAAGGQEALSLELLEWLLCEESQTKLRNVNLLSAAGIPAGYAPGSAMAAMESSVLKEGFTPSGAFNTLSELGGGMSG